MSTNKDCFESLSDVDQRSAITCANYMLPNIDKDDFLDALSDDEEFFFNDSGSDVAIDFNNALISTYEHLFDEVLLDFDDLSEDEIIFVRAVAHSITQL